MSGTKKILSCFSVFSRFSSFSLLAVCRLWFLNCRLSSLHSLRSLSAHLSNPQQISPSMKRHTLGRKPFCHRLLNRTSGSWAQTSLPRIDNNLNLSLNFRSFKFRRAQRAPSCKTLHWIVPFYTILIKLLVLTSNLVGKQR